jgi:uncharacterized protein (DUF302 family)
MSRRNVISLVALLSLVLSTLAVLPQSAQAQQAPGGPGIVVLESTQSFEETWSSLTAALDANAAIRTIAQVDHGAAAADAGLSLEPNRVIFFGNPALGTPVMQAGRTAGIDLPQKMQVFEEDGRVFVAYNAPSYIADRHGAGGAATLGTITNALAGLAQAATNTSGSVTAPASTTAGAGLVETASANDFETTWSTLIDTIDASPASVAFTVDHSANSGGVLPPTRLVVFGNPAIGTPMMASVASAGLDLPLKMLVYEDDAGVTHVVSTAPSFVQSRHGVGDVATVGAATGAIANFTAAATTAIPGAEPPVVDEDDGTAEAEEAGEEDEVLGVSELAITGSDATVALAGSLMILAGAVVLVGARRARRHE